MENRKPYIGNDGEVRELDEHFFKNATRGRPPPPKDKRKQRTTIMLDQDVIERLKKDGRDLNT